MKILARRSTSHPSDLVTRNTQRSSSKVSSNEGPEGSVGLFNSISRQVSRSLSPSPTRACSRHRNSSMHASTSFKSEHTLFQYQIKKKNWHCDTREDGNYIHHLNTQSAPSSPIKRMHHNYDMLPRTSELLPRAAPVAGFFAQDDDESNCTNNDVAIGNDDDDASVATQESEMHNSRKRMTAFVWKRKSGFRGKLKSSYVMASDTANTLSYKAKSNFYYHTMKNKLNFAVGGGRKEREKDTVVVDATVGGIGLDDQGQIQRQHGRTNGCPTLMNGKENSERVQVKMWERRQLVLEGRLLMYYHEKAGLDDDDDDDDADVGDSNGILHSNSGEHQDLSQNPKSNQPLARRLKHNFMELVHTAHLLPSNINHGFASPKPDVNTPRGVIDIIESRATASVLPVGSQMNSYAAPPTPYNLAISIKSEIKWVFSFEDPKELMNWLKVFAEIALQESAKKYRQKHGKRFTERHFFLDKEGTECERQPVCAGNGWGEVEKMAIGEENSNDVWDDDSDGLGPSFRDSRGRMTVPSTSSIGANTASSGPSTSRKDPYKVSALVNSSFLYLFLTIEEALTMSNILFFLLINFCTWLYLRNKDGKECNIKLDMIRFKKREISAATCVPFTMKSNKKGVENQDAAKLVEVPSFVERRKRRDNDGEGGQHKPLAGSTSIRLKDPHDDVEYKDGEPKVAWLAADPSIIHLRGPDYLTTRQKNPSPSSLYRLIQMDVFYADEHMTDIGRRFKLPRNEFVDQEHHWYAPDTLVVSFALPTTAPKLGRTATDRKGLIVCGYYQIRPEVRKTLEIVSNSSLTENEKEQRMHELFPKRCERKLINGILLWDKWCSTSANDPEMQKRLKFIPRGENINDLGVPSWICRYNGKPMLIKRPGETSFIFSHPDERVLEIDINLHPLPYMFKQAMAYLSSHYFARMLMTFGFVIEGRSDNELPEVLLGDPMSLPFNDITKIPKSSVVFGEKASTQ